MNTKKRSLLYVIILFIMPLLMSATVNDDKDKTTGIKWLTIDEAQKLGKKDARKIFVDVYTDWCGWCKRMDKTTFSDASVVEYVNKNYYAVKLDAEGGKTISFNGKTLTETELARFFKVSGYPTVVFMDESLQNITPVSGYRQAAEFKEMLMQFNGDKASSK